MIRSFTKSVLLKFDRIWDLWIKALSCELPQNVLGLGSRSGRTYSIIDSYEYVTLTICRSR